MVYLIPAPKHFIAGFIHKYGLVQKKVAEQALEIDFLKKIILFKYLES